MQNLTADDIKTAEQQLGKDNLFFFAKEILGYNDLSGCHKDLCGWFSGSKKKKKLILMPRGTFKSTLITKAYTLQSLVRDPNERICIISETFTNSCRFLSEIKGHIEGNKVFREIYGDIANKRGKWTDEEITVKRTKNLAESSITCAGIGVTRVGAHYTKIILDDPHSEQNIGTREQLEKVISYFRLLSPILEPEGELIVIMTRWDYGDLAGYIIEELTQQFDVYLKQAVDEEGVLLFPERLTKEFLKDQRDLLGSYFYSSQYLNEPVSRENAVFKDDWIRYYENLPESICYFMTIDPAISQERTADYTVIMILGVDERNNWYVVDYIRDRLNPRQIINGIFTLNSQYRPLQIGIETVAFQKALKFFLQEEQKNRKEFLPLKELKTDSRISKQMRIMGLQPRFEQGTIFIKKSQTPLLDELLKFPRYKTDDIVDALAYNLQIAYPNIQSKAERSLYYKNIGALMPKEEVELSWLEL